MNGCIYRTKDGECDLYSEGGKYHAFCVDGPCEGRKPSNADRIRAMTDEKLADYLWVVEHWGVHTLHYLDEWLAWLRQEADT